MKEKIETTDYRFEKEIKNYGKPPVKIKTIKNSGRPRMHISIVLQLKIFMFSICSEKRNLSAFLINLCNKNKKKQPILIEKI